MKRPACSSRYRELNDFLDFFKKTYDTMAKEIGWVGWFPIGGIDENGKIKTIQYVRLYCTRRLSFNVMSAWVQPRLNMRRTNSTSQDA